MKAGYRTVLIIRNFLLFLVAAALGTVTHESGHFIVAKILGYDARLTYCNTVWATLNSPTNTDMLLVAMAGPITTIIIGSIFFLFCVFGIEQYKKLTLSINVAVVLGLFWSREIFIFLSGLVKGVLSGKYSSGSDEHKIADLLLLPTYTISFVLFAVAVWICYSLIFRFINKQDRVAFISSGIVGSAAGYVLWFGYVGKFILPE